MKSKKLNWSFTSHNWEMASIENKLNFKITNQSTYSLDFQVYTHQIRFQLGVTKKKIKYSCDGR